MKKPLLLITLAFSLVGTLFSQENPRTKKTYDFELSDMAKRIIPVLSINANNRKLNALVRREDWIWKEGRSSALVEEDKYSYFYEINKIDDKDYIDGGECAKVDTAWVEGVKGDGIGEWVLIPIKPIGDAVSHLSSKITHSSCYEVSFGINNGYQQNEDLYRKNNRVKEAKVSVYVAPYGCGQDEAYLCSNPECVYENVFKISDEIQENPFYLNYDTHSFLVVLPEKYSDLTDPMEFYLKFEILSVYKGSKYDDTCISNLTATVDVPQ